MRRRAALVLLALASCHPQPQAAGKGDTPGDRLERAAQAAGIVADPDRVDPVGLYARDGDRVCVAAGDRGRYRFGVLVAIDDRQGCTATGSARGSGGTLAVRLGDDCRFAASIDGDRITLPPTLPAACDRFCTGRASMTALAAERLSPASAEATALRDGRGRPLCGA